VANTASIGIYPQNILFLSDVVDSRNEHRGSHKKADKSARRIGAITDWCSARKEGYDDSNTPYDADHAKNFVSHSVS
jgi:hypothetical protein